MEIFNLSKLTTPSILVIHNPYSGKKKDGTKVHSETIKALIDVGFKERDIDFEPTSSTETSEERSAEKIRNTDKSCILSIGGDSTYAGVLEANRKRGKDSLVHIHAATGTTNDIGKTYGYTTNIAETIYSVFNDGLIKEIDIFLLNGKVIAYVAGFGLLVTAAYETTTDMKAKYGRRAYMMTMEEHIKSAFHKIEREHVIVEVDGKKSEHYCALGLFSNSKSIAGISLNHRGIDLNDGKFEALLCDAKTFPELVLSLPSFKYGIKVPSTTLLRTDNIKLTFDSIPNKPWCIDGDKHNEQTNTYSINTGGKAKIVVPRAKF